jgi:glycosyltransferase involved in cell wall biosynthesis
VIELARRIRGYRPEIVHGWHLFASPYAGAVATILGARASLGSLRASFDYFRRQKLLAATTPLLVDGLVVNSRWAASMISAKYGRRFRRIYAIPNAVEEPTGPRAAARELMSRRWGIPTGRVWLGSACRFEPGKRLDLVVETFRRLRGQDADVHLVLIGDGESRTALEASVASAGLGDRVTLTGETPDARSLIGALDVFCFPSMYDEGLPNVILEASAAGVPVVAWRTPPLEELLDAGVSAALIGLGDLDGLTTAVGSLVSDSRRRDELGERARQRVLEKFSVGRLVERFSAAYDDLVGSAPA